MSNVISRIRRKIEEIMPQAITKYNLISGINGMKQNIRLNQEYFSI